MHKFYRKPKRPILNKREFGIINRGVVHYGQTVYSERPYFILRPVGTALQKIAKKDLQAVPKERNRDFDLFL